MDGCPVIPRDGMMTAYLLNCAVQAKLPMRVNAKLSISKLLTITWQQSIQSDRHAWDAATYIVLASIPYKFYSPVS